MIYTVFGIHPDNYQRHADEVEAGDPIEAEVKYRFQNGDDMLIAATMEGNHEAADGKTYAYE